MRLSSGGGGEGGGVSAHNELTALDGDDHPQYHNDARGDARYWRLTIDLVTQTELDAHMQAAAPHSGHETPAGAQDKVDTHVADPSAAHAASAISYNGSTGLLSPDVEGALDEAAFILELLDTEKSDNGHGHSGLAPAGGATGKVLKKVSAADFDYSWQDDATGSGTAREDIVAQWDVSSTKTNIGAAFVDIYTQAGSDGKSVPIDFTDKTQVHFVVLWNKVGTGTQTVQAVDAADVTKVLAEINVVTGRNDSGLVAIPAHFVGVKNIKLRAKSTTAADDPVFEGARILLK